jgi:xanthine dehydrogenase small subunit
LRRLHRRWSAGSTGRLRYEAVNACIRFLARWTGCHVVTVEHLAAKDGALHPVQQAMVDLHGSQCGFCTPGFVMSLYRAVAERARAFAVQRDREMRCRQSLPLHRLRADHRGGQRMDAAERGKDRFVAGDTRTHRRGSEGARDGETISIGDGERHFVLPATSRPSPSSDQRPIPQATLVAGATDVGLWVTKHAPARPGGLHLGRIDELQCDRADEKVTIGAGASPRSRPTTRPRGIVATISHSSDELMRRFGGEQVRKWARSAATSPTARRSVTRRRR